MRRLAVTLALALGSSTVLAPGSSRAAGRAVVDPNVGRALATGLVGPWQRTKPRPGRATVLIELDDPATAATPLLPAYGPKCLTHSMAST